MQYLLAALSHSTTLKQSVWFRISAAEVAVEYGGVFHVAFFQDVFPEALGGLPVKDAVFLEEREGVCLKHFRPLVGIVSCSVSAGEDVGETWAEGTAFGVRQEPAFLFQAVFQFFK